MGLLEQARKDIAKITGNKTTGWGASLTFTPRANKGGAEVTITGLHSKHHLGEDTDGNRVNSKNAHVSFSDSFLVAAGYPIRNLKGEMDMVGDKVKATDSTGQEWAYIIRETYPDETVGLTCCILGDFE